MIDKQQKRPDVKKIKIIKAAIVVMTSFIVFGIGVLIYTFANKKSSKVNVNQETAVVYSLEKTNEVYLGLSGDYKISSFYDRGSRIYIHAKSAKNHDKIFVVDSNFGKIITSIDIGKSDK
jgi:hypothetical protein